MEAVQKWDRYLIHHHFKLHTDAQALVWLFKRIENTFDRKNNMFMRMLLRLKPYRFTAEHIAGVENIVADHISRYLHYKRLAAMDMLTMNDELFSELSSASNEALNFMDRGSNPTSYWSFDRDFRGRKGTLRSRNFYLENHVDFDSNFEKSSQLTLGVNAQQDLERKSVLSQVWPVSRSVKSKLDFNDWHKLQHEREARRHEVFRRMKELKETEELSWKEMEWIALKNRSKSDDLDLHHLFYENSGATTYGEIYGASNFMIFDREQLHSAWSLGAHQSLSQSLNNPTTNSKNLFVGTVLNNMEVCSTCRRLIAQ